MFGTMKVKMNKFSLIALQQTKAGYSAHAGHLFCISQKKMHKNKTVIHQSYLKQFLGAKSCMKKKCAGLLYKRTASGLHTFYSYLILFDSFVQK